MNTIGVCAVTPNLYVQISETMRGNLIAKIIFRHPLLHKLEFATDRLNNSAWKRARNVAGLPMVRIHDLKHTFGRRLRAAGVSLETRKVLLGHRNGDITSHYSAPELEELMDAVEKVCSEKSGKTPALVILRQTMVN